LNAIRLSEKEDQDGPFVCQYLYLLTVGKDFQGTGMMLINFVGHSFLARMVPERAEVNDDAARLPLGPAGAEAVWAGVGSGDGKGSCKSSSLVAIGQVRHVTVKLNEKEGCPAEEMTWQESRRR
jgi:hypothetical protein